MPVNRLRRLSENKFATWVANGQLLCGDRLMEAYWACSRAAK